MTAPVEVQTVVEELKKRVVAIDAEIATLSAGAGDPKKLAKDVLFLQTERRNVEAELLVHRSQHVARERVRLGAELEQAEADKTRLTAEAGRQRGLDRDVLASMYSQGYVDHIMGPGSNKAPMELVNSSMVRSKSEEGYLAEAAAASQRAGSARSAMAKLARPDRPEAKS